MFKMLCYMKEVIYIGVYSLSDRNKIYLYGVVKLNIFRDWM